MIMYPCTTEFSNVLKHAVQKNYLGIVDVQNKRLFTVYVRILEIIRQNHTMQNKFFLVNFEQYITHMLISIYIHYCSNVVVHPVSQICLSTKRNVNNGAL